MQQAQVLELRLHRHLVGHLVGYESGRNVLVFSKEFSNDPKRPTFSLTTNPAFPHAHKLLSNPWTKTQRLHPTLSNLLPEGALREYIAQSLKVHTDSEFEIFANLGKDLPGALIATPMAPDQVPQSVLNTHGEARAIEPSSTGRDTKFSLAGVQMKFSMQAEDGRFNLAADGSLGDWIVKTPSTRHAHVPRNEFSAMSLAKMVGVTIPETKLVALSSIGDLPPINLPKEEYAFAIKRFDRADDRRIHAEDFAQILFKYPQQKYGSASYEQIGKIIYEYSQDPLGDAQQFARRLLVNILLANGDAHLKNWSVVYPDQITPRLSPAYDILTTRLYIEDEKDFALNLGKTRSWYHTTIANFEHWATRSGIPWRAIRPHLYDVLERARTLWPSALSDLPVTDAHKMSLIDHWERLSEDFRIET